MAKSKEPVPPVETNDVIKKIDGKKYLKVLTTEPALTFKMLGERIMRKEIKLAHYTTENSVGVYYYLIINE